MRLISIYLQYPWKFPDSPYYTYLIKSPPSEIEYLNISKEKGVITDAKKFKEQTRLKLRIRKYANLLRLPIPNAHLTRTKESHDLIHCAHCLSLNHKPWVADIESVWSMWVGGRNTNLGRYFVKKILSSKNCKKIMPWTNKTKKDILEIFPELEKKIEVVYPAVPLLMSKKKSKKRVTLLYASRHFHLKGGLLTLEVFSKLKERYGDKVNLIFISDVPNEIKIKYPQIKILGLVPSEKLREYYQKSDIFFYPSFVDTFGFAILEAMSHGLPIISIENDEIRKELITEGKTGLMVKTKLKYDEQDNQKFNALVSDLVKKASLLIEDKKLLEKMSKACIEEIKNGKFSIKERNKKLKRIYEEAIKN